MKRLRNDLLEFAEQSAFTLVELSIVLVILGLLVGGVLAGQSLIRSAELRAIGKEYDGYVVAVNAFKDKYMALPGDMTNATAFWGKDNAACAGDTGTAATPGTCNGNGDGKIQWGTIDLFRFWQQLSLAGLIEGNYTGVTGPAGEPDAVLGVNAPKSRMSGGGWGVGNIGYYAGDALTFALDYGNYYNFGAQLTFDNPIAGIITPAEAWNVDTKFDDGRPGRGHMMSVHRDTCTDSTSATDYDADYLLATEDKGCSLVFPSAVK